MNYLATYFYFDNIEGNYGNIQSKHSAAVYNRIIQDFYCISSENFTKVFFTNSCPDDIKSSLTNNGVIIFENLNLSYRHDDRWNTVTFVFDVVEFILNSDSFLDDDTFILTDADVLVVRLESLFDFISNEESSCHLYSYGSSDEVNGNLQGLRMSRIREVLNGQKKISLIGGEFLAFTKKMLPYSVLSEWRLILSKYNFYTEEQVWTVWYNQRMLNVSVSLCDDVFRLWLNGNSVLRPDKPLLKYSIIHMPGEKSGLLQLINNSKRELLGIVNYRLLTFTSFIMRIWRKAKLY